MEDCIRIVQEHYDSDVQYEWDRLKRHPFEFAITTKMMDRYIKPGDRILDIGGGPGRYSIYYAQKGCNITLVDLSEEKVKSRFLFLLSQHILLQHNGKFSIFPEIGRGTTYKIELPVE